MVRNRIYGATWTCTGSGGGACSAAGAGDIADIVDLPVMGQVVFVASGVVGSGVVLSNTAEVIPPMDIVEIDIGNNVSRIIWHRKFY